MVVDALRAIVEEERERFGAPGVAVAVVRDDETLLAEGFGLRDVAGDLPVTANTVFPLASISKSFTAALAGSLVDDGLLEWDRPIREYLPWFRIADQAASELLSVRDFLAHRSGLPRHDLVTFGNPGICRGELVRRLRHLAPNRSFRESWEYNNLGYITVGYLCGELLGTSFEEGVRSRLLEPLGMDATTVTQAELYARTERPLPYRDDEGEPAQLAFERTDLGAPAGGIASCVTDLAIWARAHLPSAGVGADVGLSAAVIDELTSAVMPKPAGLFDWPETFSVGYGMGWSIESYRGDRLVAHGGNWPGYCTQLTLLPDRGLGVVVLANLDASGIRDTIPYRLIDVLLVNEPVPWGTRFAEAYASFKEARRGLDNHRLAGDPSSPPSHPIDDYAGSYEHPAYGTFDVSVEGERLMPAFHGLDLELVHRHFDVWTLRIPMLDITVPVAFQTGFGGGIDALLVGFEPQVEPIAFGRAPDPELHDPDELERLAGRYAHGPLAIDVEVGPDGVLTADLPTQGRVQLAPLRGMTFQVRGRRYDTVEFVVDGGEVQRVVVDPLGVFVRKDSSWPGMTESVTPGLCSGG